MSSNLVINIAIFIAVGVASFLLAKVTPKVRTDAGLAIRPTFVIPVVGLFSFAVAALCLYGFITSGALPPLVLAVAFALGGAFLTNVVRTIFVVSCDQFGVEGPDSLLLAPRRRSIVWTEIKRVAISWTGSLFVEATDGRRIYFSTAYAGYGHLVDEIYRNRPDLKPNVQS